MSLPFPDPPKTLQQALERAATHFEDRGVAIFDGKGTSHQRRTYAEILEAARQAAGRWAALGVEPGDPVLIAVPTSWDWFDGWMGALMRGALPVAVAPGAALGGADAEIPRLEALIERYDLKRVLAGPGVRAAAIQRGFGRTAESAVTRDELADAAPVRFTAPRPEPEECGFLQLTSGSTGLPQAVQISHRAAVHNTLAIDEAIGVPHGSPTHAWADSVVSWLPLHHDMALLGCLFLSLACGHDLWLFQPKTFLARPHLWLEHLGSHGVALTTSPNFGYQLALERVTEGQRERMDLGPWHDAMVGAEMIHPGTIGSYCEAFGPCGFRPETFRPCYGLAEATLAVTFDQRACGMRTRPLPEAAAADLGMSEVVCVGTPVRDTELRIAASDGSALPEGQIGEVWVRGPGLFSGYLNDPEATAEGFKDGWLRTGDLGFLHESELYITGRTKDLIIIHGDNFMPHQIEWLAEEVTGGGGSMRACAFSVMHGVHGEAAVVVVEVTERDPDRREQMAHEIRSRVGRTLSLPLADLVFVRRGRIPKTTSGKVRRRVLRASYLNGEIERL